VRGRLNYPSDLVLFYESHEELRIEDIICYNTLGAEYPGCYSGKQTRNPVESTVAVLNVIGG